MHGLVGVPVRNTPRAPFRLDTIVPLCRMYRADGLRANGVRHTPLFAGLLLAWKLSPFRYISAVFSQPVLRVYPTNITKQITFYASQRSRERGI